MTTDLRRYASQTTIRLVVGSVVILFVIGLGVIWWIYGLGAALMGMLCLIGALIPVGLIWFFLFGMDWVVKKLERE
jgi:hypothetical protein